MIGAHFIQMLLVGSVSFGFTNSSLPFPLITNPTGNIVKSAPRISLAPEAVVDHAGEHKIENTVVKHPPAFTPLLDIAGNILVTDRQHFNSLSISVSNIVPSLLASVDTEDMVALANPDQNPQESAEETKTQPEKKPVIGVAERLEIQSLSIDIAVKPGAYDPKSGTWQVDESASFHADTTVPVNDTNGASLIYGHARWGIFGALPDIQPGAEAVVHAKDGLIFVYTFASVDQVEPTDVSMLTSEGDPRLLLQTCSGLFDQYRTVATFSLKEVKKA